MQKTDLHPQTTKTTALPKALLLSTVSDDVALLNLLPPGGKPSLSSVNVEPADEN